LFAGALYLKTIVGRKNKKKVEIREIKGQAPAKPVLKIS
jgi:hypothetical protein